MTTLYPHSKARMNSWSRTVVVDSRPSISDPTSGDGGPPARQPSILDTASTMGRCGVSLIPRRGEVPEKGPEPESDHRSLPQPTWGRTWISRRRIPHLTAGSESGEGALLLWYRGVPRQAWECTGAGQRRALAPKTDPRRLLLFLLGLTRTR